MRRRRIRARSSAGDLLANDSPHSGMRSELRSRSSVLRARFAYLLSVCVQHPAGRRWYQDVEATAARCRIGLRTLSTRSNDVALSAHCTLGARALRFLNRSWGTCPLLAHKPYGLVGDQERVYASGRLGVRTAWGWRPGNCRRRHRVRTARKRDSNPLLRPRRAPGTCWQGPRHTGRSPSFGCAGPLGAENRREVRIVW